MMRDAEKVGQKFRGMVEGLDASIGIVDYEGSFLYLNDYSCRRIGWLAGEYLGKTIWDAFPKDIADNHIQYIRRVLDTGLVEVVEVATVLQGKPGWYRGSLQPYQDGDGKTIGVLVLATDIEEGLHQALGWQEKVFEGSRDAIFISESDGRIIAVNRAGCELAGLERSALLGKKILEFHPPEKGEIFSGYLSRILAGEPLTVSTWIPTREGGRAYVKFVNHRIEIDHRFYVHTTGRDITEQKKAEESLRESEERYRLLYETLSQGVICRDGKGKVISANPAAREILGWTGEPNRENPDEIIPAKAIHEDGRDFPPEDYPSFIALTTGRPVRDVCMGVFNPLKGEVRWVQVNSIPQIRPGEKKPFRVYTTFSDVTEHRGAEAELHEYREKMSRAEQLASVGVLGATFAHEMNQPLTAIRLFLQQSVRELEKAGGPEGVLSNLRDSLREVTRAITITNQFLQASRRKAEPATIEIRFEKIAERVRSLLLESARQAKMKLVLESMAELPAMEGDPGEIEQMFFILIQNAIQAGKGRKSSALHIRGRVTAEGVELEFSDTCGGIAPENLDRIFQPFFSTKPPGIGTGLGLCILQRMVTERGGKVRVENRAGEGVSFFVSLPVKG